MSRRLGGRGPDRTNPARWQRTRRAVFARDGHRCVDCKRPGRLECDHVVPLWRNPNQDPYDPANCATRCRGCHIRKTAAENEHRRKAPTPAVAAWANLVSKLSTSMRYRR